MEDKEAIKLLQDFERAIFKGYVAIEHQKKGYEESQRIGKILDDERKEKYKLERVVNEKSQLLNAYIRKFGELFELCPDCNGAGGFDYGEEGGEMCQRCEGVGIAETNSKTLLSQPSAEWSLIRVKRESDDSQNSPHDSSTIKEEANFS